MHTQVLTLGPSDDHAAAIARAAQLIRDGGLVAFPTETVYGLGANARDAQAVAGIYRAKERSPEDPCIVHIAGPERLAEVAVLPPALAGRVQALAAAFWPGPLSLILPRAEAIPPIVTAGRPAVAVRVPAHPVALALIRTAGLPIAAPSANTFMHTSPTTARHVLDDLDGRIDLLLDGGPTSVGIESTVLDLSAGVPAVLRPGGISLERLRAVLGPVAGPAGGDRRQEEGLPAPGLLERHYAPRAAVILLDGPRQPALAELARRAAALLAGGTHTGALLSDEDAGALEVLALPGLAIARLGPADDLELAARRLFAGLRELEQQGVAAILARSPAGQGLGLAIRDRLVRAAGGAVIAVAGQ